ncbi:uncharacterized protein LOC133529961 isoform X2 [Cydia pomonella]|uniref:uncharacterized protein LOC133529961 isoform X2 n=1 Tax=Cydia pomonella TaxID=82600 RepID=UPI002ADE4F8E|nr:uncharacterized protein LOC133529961 isoform X2 [Cydia pomonella]
MQHKLLCLVVVVALVFIHVEAGMELKRLDDDEENELESEKHTNLGDHDEENEQDIEKTEDINEDMDPALSASNEEIEQEINTQNWGNDIEQNKREHEPPINTNRGLDFEPMKPDVAKQRGLKCVPGRTVVRMERKQVNQKVDDDDDYRRTHMNWQEDKTKEDCKICTCSIEGKDEYCSGRPARNLNECLVLARLSEELGSNMPFSHERELSNMIRRYGAQKGQRRPSCIPYVSEYSDCSEYTTCRGCNQCRCSSEGEWVCYKKKNTCTEDSELEIFEDGTEDNVVGTILQELAHQERDDRSKKRPTHLAPLPEKRQRATESPVLDFDPENAMKELQEIMRGKRSLKELNETDRPIQFHHTIDEINEDTLKNSNITGTLGVRKVDPAVKASRRSGLFVNSTSDPLHIEYNHPTIYNNHITDNKIETSHNADQDVALANEKMHNIVNYTQNVKDKELSKIVVNELKKGEETIGDPKAPVASNITFTPEKDTLTAMAYIAGNLLNKLWNLERDSTDDSIETDNMKNQKIADLLDLFKEPLTYRQEVFLKDALEHLSEAVHKNKDNKHFSLCETVDEMKKDIVGDDKIQEVKKEEKKLSKNLKSADNALSKLIEVLDLIKKYEVVQTNLQSIKHPKDISTLSTETPYLRTDKNDSSSLNLFGNILEKITNLLMPNNKRMKNKIRNQNILRNAHNLEEDVKKTFNINVDGMKLTAADKLIMDYINRLQSNPCPLSNQQEDKSIRNKQSDILLNLSEFFKIKSYSDLMNIVDPKLQKTSTQPTPTTVKYLESRRTSENNTSTDIENNNTLSLNDKLKLHLKAIVNDLIELQNEKGKNIKSGDFNITDALPCILKIINQEKNQLKGTKYYTQSALLNKIKSVLEAVKKDIREMPQSRRSMNTGPRPKSVVVWERVVKNLDQNPQSSRRFFKIVKPQSYEVVKKMIDNVESNSSNTYKSVALSKDIPAADKLLFLKTLSMETINYAAIIGKLLVLNREKKLPEKDLDDLFEFVDTATTNLDLNTKVVRDLDKPKQKRFNVLPNNKQASKTNKMSDINDSFKLNSELTITQLITNRVKQYMKMKESEKATEDMGYNIAQRILSNLERGSERLARELYKILIETSQREKSAPGKYINHNLRQFEQ